MTATNSNFTLSLKGRETYLGVWAYFIVAILVIMITPLALSVAIFVFAIPIVGGVLGYVGVWIVGLFPFWILLSASVRRLRSVTSAWRAFFFEIAPVCIIFLVSSYLLGESLASVVF